MLSPLLRTPPLPRLALPALITLLAFAVRLSNPLDEPIHHTHAFRQAHVASNIEHFAAQGLALESTMYALNSDVRFFEFPLYAWVTTGIVWNRDLSAVAAARVLNLTLLPFFLAALAMLLWACGERSSTTSLTLLFAALSPLKVYYDHAPLPDNLGLVLSVGSLAFFLATSEKQWGRRGVLGAIGLAFLAALLKAPTHLSAALAVMLWTLRGGKLRDFFRPLPILYLAASGLGVIVYVLVSGTVNPPGTFSASWYFGGDRLAASSYGQMMTYLLEIATALGLTLATIGIVAAWRSKGHESMHQPAFLLSYATAWGLTVGLFFNLHVVHNYYWLPAIVPVCWAAAFGVDAVSEAIGARSRHVPHVGRAILAIAVAALMFTSPIGEGPNPVQLAEGAFLQTHVPEDARILFLQSKPTWDPKPFYYAKRYGYNVQWNELFDTQAQDPDLVSSDYLFVPQRWSSGRAVHKVYGWQLVAQDSTGTLFTRSPAL